MLISLHVTNFAIVDFLELDFSDGMTAFTGETGAGKSIMIDALALALGSRADNSVIRKGAKQCEISAVFSIDQVATPYSWCTQHDIDIDDNTIILRRVIQKEGRSKCYINGQPHPVQKIKELSEMLVDIHGQHQHQTLLNHPTHRQQLDNYANHVELLQQVTTSYKTLQHLQKQLEQLQQQEINQDKMELLNYQVQELNALALGEGELATLNEEHEMLAHAKAYLENTKAIIHALNADDAPCMLSLLQAAKGQLDKLPEEQIEVKQCAEMLNSALIQCEEALSEIEQFDSKITLDPSRLFEIENRLETIYDLARKHHITPKELLSHQCKLQNELHALYANEEKTNTLGKEIIAIKETYLLHCQKLSQSRMNAAKKLTQNITCAIKQLGMPKGCVEIDISPLDKMHVHGMDKVEYKVCTNPGMAMDSLAKIASGGELSRISLAIQVITAQKSSTPTLLFDEVDVGIGGATAAMVGQLLRNLGKRLQVFCVTHQAQVAANAHHHFLVAKYEKNQNTFSTITQLEKNQKINEIARMLGGLTITEHTLNHAKELLNQQDEQTLS
jgi:DNA repair protein RecN (Recombination protein N)